MFYIGYDGIIYKYGNKQLNIKNYANIYTNYIQEAIVHEKKHKNRRNVTGIYSAFYNA